MAILKNLPSTLDFRTNNTIKIRNKYGYRLPIKESQKKRKKKKAFLKIKKAFLKIKDSKEFFAAGKKRLLRSKPKKREIVYKIMKPPRPKKKRVFIYKKTEVGIISIQSTANNTILTLADHQGNTKAWSSSGTSGFKNGSKASRLAAEAAARRLAEKSVKLGYYIAQVKMKGVGYGKLKAIRMLCRSKLKLIRLQHKIPLAHNGCRKPRKPRK